LNKFLKILGEEHPNTLITKGNVGGGMQVKFKVSEALNEQTPKALNEQALEALNEQALEALNEQVSEALDEQASEALDEYEQVLASDDKILG